MPLSAVGLSTMSLYPSGPEVPVTPTNRSTQKHIRLKKKSFQQTKVMSRNENVK